MEGGGEINDKKYYHQTEKKEPTSKWAFWIVKELKDQEKIKIIWRKITYYIYVL